jgi:hypothetical protein
VITLLVAPLPTGDDEAGSLSTFAASPAGARGLFEILDRLGWSLERRLAPMRETLESGRTYVVLEPAVPFTSTEVHYLLEAVRSGARLLTVPALDGRLADSLRAERAAELPQPGGAPSAARRPVVTQDSTRTFGPGWVRWVLRAPSEGGRAGDYVPPEGASVLLSLDTDRGREPMVVGFPMGQGRIIVAADPGLFRNSTLQNHPGAVRVVRYIEWLQQGATDLIVFDEYHHGHGTHANVVREAERALTETAPGRAVLHMALAGLVLLLALGARPIKPGPVTRIERRSPLEHVGALARAYAAIQAVPRATQLLVRGLRRRHHGAGTGDERLWLQAIRQQHPDVSTDIDQIAGALDGRVESVSGAHIATSMARIERALEK